MSEHRLQRERELAGILGQISGQLRGQLEDFHRALEALSPPDAGPVIDQRAAPLWRSYFRLLRLAGNLAGLGREVQLANDDLVGLCRAVADRAALPAELLDLRLEFRCGRTSHIAAVDAGLLERLLLNLLSNAFRFTPQGGSVVLEVRPERDWVRLTVSDTGSGLGAAVFDRPLGDRLPAPPPHGLGLGLPLCRQIAQGHGGSLVLSSGGSGGTTAVLSLPNRRVEDQAAALWEVDLYGGYNQTLVELADALPEQAFARRFLD